MYWPFCGLGASCLCTDRFEEYFRRHVFGRSTEGGRLGAADQTLLTQAEICEHHVTLRQTQTDGSDGHWSARLIDNHEPT